MTAKDIKALDWLYKNGTVTDNIKSSVFFYGLKGLYSNLTKFDNKSYRKKLDSLALRYQNIVYKAIDRKTKCSDKQYCLLLHSNMIALQKGIPTRELPLKKRKDVIKYMRSSVKSPIKVYIKKIKIIAQ